MEEGMAKAKDVTAVDDSDDREELEKATGNLHVIYPDLDDHDKGYDQVMQMIRDAEDE